ncbi:MAG: hypothetical protein Q9194_006641 [Teloschistes cf. exilis]
MVKSKPIGLAWRSSTLFIVSTVGIGLFTDLFFYGLIVPLLPFMLKERINIPPDQIQGYTSGLLAAYAGASVLFSPLAGVIADRVSTRQAPFLIGLVALLGATLMLFLGKSIAVLIVARILQGISAAVVWTIGLALVLDSKTIGSIFGFISIGELAAPVLGGVLYKKTGFPGVFGVAFGILAIDFIMRIFLIEKKVAARWEEAQEEQSEEDAHQNEEDGNTEDANEEEPLLRKKEEENYRVPEGQSKAVRSYPILFCLKDPRLLTALLMALTQASLLSTFDATIPTEAEQLFNFDSLKSGLLFIALVLPYLILGPVAGWLVDRYGPKPAAVLGFGYLVPTLILLRLVRPGGTPQIVIYCVLLSLNGFGLAAIGSPSIVEASTVVGRYHKANPDFFGEQGPYAQLYGLNSMVFSAGLTLGPVVSGALKDWLFGFAIADKIPALQDRDREAHSIAAILHDLAWDHTNELISKDDRFEVDGANAARNFLKKEATGPYDKHRLQLVWDSIALHTTPSIALHKEPEVVATFFGIAADFTGVPGAPNGALTQGEYDAIVKEVPRLGFNDDFREVFCGLCRTKPQTTYDNMVGDWGEKYVEGYTRLRGIDMLEAGLEMLG